MIKTIREFLHIFFKKFLPKTPNHNLEFQLTKNFKEIPDIFRYLKFGKGVNLMLASPAGPLAEMTEIYGEKSQEQVILL